MSDVVIVDDCAEHFAGFHKILLIQGYVEFGNGRVLFVEEPSEPEPVVLHPQHMKQLRRDYGEPAVLENYQCECVCLTLHTKPAYPRPSNINSKYNQPIIPRVYRTGTGCQKFR